MRSGGFTMNFFVAGTKKNNSDILDFSMIPNNPLEPFALDILKEFHNITESNILNNVITDAQETINMNTLFQELDTYAAPYFHTTPSLKLSTLNNTLTIAQNENIIYLNSVMPSALFSYIAIQIYHGTVLKNYSEYMFCYRYTLFVLNEMCYHDFKQPVTFPDADSLKILMGKFVDKENLLHITSDLYYTSTAFALLHEIAHAYLKHDSDDIENEYEADCMAYKIFLNYCYDVNNKLIKSNFNDCMPTYTYLAPMYLLDFYHMIYYTGSFLCHNCEPVKNETFELIIERQEKLKDIFQKWERDQTTDLPYSLYNHFLDGQEHFLNIFVSSDKKGMLDEIKHKNMQRGLI